MATETVSGYTTGKGKRVKNYYRTQRSKKHIFDHKEKGTYARNVDTFHRYYGDIDYKAKRYKG